MIDGRPLSIEVVGDLYREDAVLRVGAAISRGAGDVTWPDTSKIPG